VPGYEDSHFEKTVLQQVYCNMILTKHGDAGAFRFLAQKTSMFPPNVMLQHDVEVYKAVLNLGKFVTPFLEHIMLDLVMVIFHSLLGCSVILTAHGQRHTVIQLQVLDMD